MTAPAVGMYDVDLNLKGWFDPTFASLGQFDEDYILASGAAATAILGTSTVTVNLTGSGAIAAAITDTSSVTVSLSGTGALASVIEGATTVLVVITGSGVLASAISGDGVVSGTLSGAGVLAATISGTSSITSVLAGIGAIFAALAGSSSVVCALLGSGSMSCNIEGVGTVVCSFSAGGGSASINGFGTLSVTFTGAGPVVPLSVNVNSAANLVILSSFFAAKGAMYTTADHDLLNSLQLSYAGLFSAYRQLVQQNFTGSSVGRRIAIARAATIIGQLNTTMQSIPTTTQNSLVLSGLQASVIRSYNEIQVLEGQTQP